MNVSKLYAQSTGKGPSAEDSKMEKEHDEASKSPSAGRTQLKINWLNSTITQELLTKLAEEKKALIAVSIALANSYHVHQNHLEIIKNLIMAQQIQHLIDSTDL